MELSKTWADVDRYLCDLLLPADAALDHAVATSAAANLPAIAVQPNQGKLLYLLAKLSAARTILEIGTLGGYSTIWLGRALPAGGKLVTLELEPRHAEVARGNLQFAGLTDRVVIHVGSASDILPTLSGPFDFIFVDADKMNLPFYFQWSLKLSRAGTVIVVDNVVRNGEVVDPDCQDIHVKGVQAFLQLAAAEARIEATAFQTVGGKGYDGMAVLRVKD